MVLDPDEEWRWPKPLEWGVQQDGERAAKARSLWRKQVSPFGYSFHKGVNLGLVSGGLEENWDVRDTGLQRKAPIIELWAILRDSTMQQELGLTFLVSESKGSGVGVLAFWASSGGGANTRGSPRGRAAAKFISG